MFDKLLARHGLSAPDGRPLHAYGLGDKGMTYLSQFLIEKMRQNLRGGRVPAAFVLWASERIRRDFQGGSISWDFVFAGLCMPADRSLAVSLVSHGLRWWRRSVRASDAGRDLYLFTLMAEGGLPNALLAQATHYQKVMVDLVTEIERAGPEVDVEAVLVAARRWVGALPQAFQNADGAHLLADLANVIVALRRSVPADIPMDAADRWLDQNRSEWQGELPLRLSDEAADALVRGVLRAEREAAPPACGPIAARELRCDEAGRWSSWVRLAERGFISEHLLGSAIGKRLRLLPIGGDGRTAAVAYAATPDRGGWEIQRIGGRGDALVPLRPQHMLRFGAYADSKACGEIQITPARSLDQGEFCFWKAGDGSDPTAPVRLVEMSESARTRQPALWLLAGTEVEVEALDAAVSVGPTKPCEGGYLRRIAGDGFLRVGGERITIRTSAEAEAPRAALSVAGNVLSQWRISEDGSLVVLGEPIFVGTREGGSAQRLRKTEVDLRAGRNGRYGERVCIWTSGGEALARLRFCSLPPGVKMDLREVRQGAVGLAIEGLPPGLHLRLNAAKAEKTIRLDGRPAALELEVPGVPPGEVRLRVWNALTGATLTLKAAWPARAGIMLDPEGRRLVQSQPIAGDALRGWRAIVPQQGDLQFSLVDPRLRVALAVSGEVPLVAHLPLIRALLAQGGPDAQVNLRLIVGGQEGPRLEIRRYHDHSVVHGGRAYFGLKRDTPHMSPTAFGEALLRTNGALVLTAVNLEDPEKIAETMVGEEASFNLDKSLPPDDGPWLVQARLDGRAQRPFAWKRGALVQSSRAERIARYTTMWEDFMAFPEGQEWDQTWTLIRTAARAGDAGTLDQVQALADVPRAAVSLLLRLPAAMKPEALALEFAAPIFWQAIPVAAFVEALNCELSRQEYRYRRVFEGTEVWAHAQTALAKSIGEIVRLRPDLAGHFALALSASGLPPFCIQGEQPVPLKGQDPDAALREAANASVCRSDRLPSGVQGLEPLIRPFVLNFNPYAQPVIDAPLVAAEVVLGQRDRLGPIDLLKLINLRLVDPVYFDAALPLAIQIGASRCALTFKKPSSVSPNAPPPALSQGVASSRRD